MKKSIFRKRGDCVFNTADLSNTVNNVKVIGDLDMGVMGMKG